MIWEQFMTTSHFKSPIVIEITSAVLKALGKVNTKISKWII